MSAVNAYRVQASLPLLQNLKVLVVEPEKAIADLLMFDLESADAEVFTVRSIAETLLIVEEFQPDVLMVNLTLPDGSGYSLLDQLKLLAPQLCRTIPAIALTRSRWTISRDRTLAAGFQYYLFQPFERGNVLTAVREVIQPLQLGVAS